ncbi:hypothetical protein [Staphylococcus kloosii]|uniref:hypothetical protein n=1 Tax=Staphylococcus kloosii TaxID=29384 RepID=UPI00189E1D6D|nr:hypothetical protein [Staphylococcus kloosii]MBF7020978.1 hypothetical protein [Staphylococcus kloosii]
MRILILTVSVVILLFIICANFKNMIKIFNEFLDEIKRPFNKIKSSLSINEIKKSFRNLSKDKILNLMHNKLKLNSVNKFGFTIVLILLILLSSGYFDKYINFVFIELIIIFTYLMFINLFNSDDEITRIFFGQVMAPAIALGYYLPAFNNLMDNQTFEINTFIIFLTFIILSLYSSIISYYNSKRKIFRVLNLTGCIMHILITSIILFSYIGVGFMFFDMNSFHSNTNNLFINVKGEQNKINSFGVVLSYGLDKITDSSGIQITSVKTKDEVYANGLVFSIISRAFVTTYIALVFAFISNSLFSRSGKDKN